MQSQPGRVHVYDSASWTERAGANFSAAVYMSSPSLLVQGAAGSPVAAAFSSMQEDGMNTLPKPLLTAFLTAGESG